MPKHKDERARDTTLIRHFLTKMTSRTKKKNTIQPCAITDANRLSFQKQLKDSFIFSTLLSHTYRQLSESNEKYYLFSSKFFIHKHNIKILRICQEI